MKPVFAWLTQSSARILMAILLVTLGYFIADSYRKGEDLKQACELLGSHAPTGQDVGADRQTIDRICLGQEADDE